MIYSSDGDKKNTVTASDCCIFIPSAIELSQKFPDGTQWSAPYNLEGDTIGYFLGLNTNDGNNARVCCNAYDEPSIYFTRSPNASSDYAMYSIPAHGQLYSGTSPTAYNYVRIMFSI